MLRDGGATGRLRPGHSETGHPKSPGYPGPERVSGDPPPRSRWESLAKLLPEGVQTVHQVRRRWEVHCENTPAEHPGAPLQLPPGPAKPLPQNPEHQAPGLAGQQASERAREAQSRFAPQL